MIFKNNKTYDFLKFLVMKGFPALEFLVLTVFKIWNLPYGSEIGATMAAITTALGIVLGISSNKYNNMEIDTDTTLDDELLVERDDE